MKKIIFLILFILLCNNCFSVIWYVSEGGRGNNDGTSWSNAAADFPDLFQNPYIAPGNTQGLIKPNIQDTIFVSEGIYSPILLWYDDSSQTNTFKNEIHIYGGFKGWENSLQERMEWSQHPSIIDAKHLTYCIWVESYKKNQNQYVKHVVIDGFTLINGYGQGGAIRVVNETPLFSNLIVKENEGFPVLYFENARDTFDRYLGNTILNNCIVDNNTIVEPSYIMPFHNALISALQSDVRFTNNTMVNNDTELNSSYFFNLAFNSTVWVDNCIIFYNDLFGEDLNLPCNIIYRFSNIEKSSGSNFWNGLWYGTDGGNNIDQDPFFVDFYNKDYHLSDKSPCINAGSFNPRYNIIIAYGYTNMNFYHNYDFDGKPRLFQNQIDMGAYEYQELLNYAPSNQNIFDNNNSIIDYDKLIIFDLTGRIIAELSNINDIYSLVLTNGIYFISYYKDDILKFSNKFIINN